MGTIRYLNPAKVYYGGKRAAYLDSNYNNCRFDEWQIDAIKEDLSHFCETKIERSFLSYEEKEEQKRQLKQILEVYILGVKDELRAEGKFVCFDRI